MSHIQDNVSRLQTMIENQEPGRTLNRPPGEFFGQIIIDRPLMIISFKGFKDPLPQGRIDKLYEVLKPTKETKQQFDVLTPAKVEEALGSRESPEDKKQLLGQLKSKLSLSEAVLITIDLKDNWLDIENELIEVQTGNVLSRSSQKSITESDLPMKLRNSVFSLVLR